MISLKDESNIMATASWVIIDKSTGEAVLETFNARTVAAVNTARYSVVPIEDYLIGVNAAIKVSPQG